MAAIPNRSAIYTKCHKVLKKHYKPVAPPNLSVLETLMYAFCLENSTHETAEQSFERLKNDYYDWNEVRVTTVTELSGSMQGAHESAANLKRTLHSLFEIHYSFDLEALRKQNIGKAVKQFEKYDGITPFAVAYTVQSALAGHSIPIDKGVVLVLYAIGAINEDEVAKGAAPGLERAIPKSKGAEFGSLIHQVGVDLMASPFSPKVRAILTEIASDAKERLPKRATKKKKASKKEAPAKKKTTKTKKTTAKKKTTTKKKTKSKSASAKKTAKKTSSKQLAKRKPR